MEEPLQSTISSDQNSDDQLLRLAAFSAIYSRGKLILAIQVILTVLGGVASAIAVAKVSNFKVWAVSYSFGVALLDALVLEPQQSELRKLGTKIQEVFDCQLFHLPWRGLVCGDPPEPEVIAEEGTKYTQKHADLSHLRDWYPAAVSKVSLPLARLICQRSNPWWDFSLRKRYRLGLNVILWLLAVFVVSLAIYTRITVASFVLAVLAPLTPAILWGAREMRKQTVAMDALERLKNHIGQIWTAVLEGNLKGEVLDQASVGIQNETFRLRSENPLIFNWVNNLLRDRQQQTMNQVAEEMVAEALHKGLQA